MSIILDSSVQNKILKINNIKIAPVTKASNVLLDDGNSILSGLISNDNIDSGTLSIINGKLYANFRIVTSAEMKAIEEAGERLSNVIYFISDDDQEIPEIIQNFGQADNGNLTFNGTEYLPTTGGTITGSLNLNSNIYMNNDSGIVVKKKDGNNTRLAWMSNTDTMYYGSKDCQTNINSLGTPYIVLPDGSYPMYHAGNKPTASDIKVNTTLFAGYLASVTITNSADISTIAMDSATINKNCFTGDYFTAPEDGDYLFTGTVEVTNVTTEGIYRVIIQVETESSSYVDSVCATNEYISTDYDSTKTKLNGFAQILHMSKNNRVKFYHNVDNGATYTLSKTKLAIIKLN